MHAHTDPVCLGTCHCLWRGAHRRVVTDGWKPHSPPPPSWAHPALLAGVGISGSQALGGTLRGCQALGGGSTAWGSCCLGQLRCRGATCLFILSMRCPGAQGWRGRKIGPCGSGGRQGHTQAHQRTDLAGWQPGPGRSGSSPQLPGKAEGERKTDSSPLLFRPFLSACPGPGSM